MVLFHMQEQHENELAKRTNDSGDNDKENEEGGDDSSVSVNLVERIYMENRKKAARAEAYMPSSPMPTVNAIVYFL